MNRRVALVEKQKLLSRDAGSPDLISADAAASSLAAIAAKNIQKSGFISSSPNTKREACLIKSFYEGPAEI
jgi:hypothetical protein